MKATKLISSTGEFTIKIEANEKLLSPCGKFHILPCDKCHTLQWVETSAVSTLCIECYISMRNKTESYEKKST